ncbi:MAG: UvrD-helicase domain-containing protein [Bacillota bacterium]
MVLHKILNKFTDRDKLAAEIEELKLRISHIQQEGKTINDELLKYKKLSSKLFSMKQELQAQLQKSHDSYQLLKEQTTQLIMDNQRLTQSENAYKQRYGEFNSYTPSIKVIDDRDGDKGFFDSIEKIKGNPFNEHQIEAIRYDMKKNLRIIAGAGSGKTETVCAKTAYLVLMESKMPSRICMVTFTSKAAEEMKERVHMFLMEENSQVVIGTFHSIFKSLFEQLCKRIPACKAVGVSGPKGEDSEEQANRLFSSLIREFKLFQFNNEGNKSIKERIEYWSSLGYNLERMRDFVEKHYNSLEDASDYPIHQRFYDLCLRYRQLRSEQNIVVFDDYLNNLYQAMQEYEDAREYIRGKFDYIFVDEFQDINPLQMAILKLIAPSNGSRTKLIIVGDDDQSIYAFRGSDPSYIGNFHETYNTHTLKLMTNYRSKQNIVDAGNLVIQTNKTRIEKSMTPFHQVKGEAYVWAANTPSDEAQWIISKAEEIGQREPFCFDGKTESINYSSSTILYRSNGQLQSLLQALDRKNIPYVIENNNEVMGIFNIMDFKWAFNNWVDLVQTNNRTMVWERILYNTATSYFISKEKFNRFYKNYEYTIMEPHSIQDFIAFVSRENSNQKVSYVTDYLNSLLRLLNNPSAPINHVVESFFQFPKMKKSIQEEEASWIKKACIQYSTLGNMKVYHDRLLEKKRKMKEHLALYHKGELNALYLLTIHKSKGLAFDNVLVVGLYNGGLPSSRAVDLEAVNLIESREKAEPPTTIEEERRLMYVAVTRAKHNLYVTYPKTKQDKPCGRSKFIDELKLEIRNL